MPTVHGMRVRWSRLACRALCAVLAVAVTAAYASDPSPRSRDASRDAIGADFGSGWNILSIPAAAFQKRFNGTVVDYTALGYVHVASGAGDLWAPIPLPSGAGLGR